MGVLVAIRAQAHFAGNLNHEFAAQRAGHILVVNDDLHEAGRITKVDEATPP